MTYRPLRKVNSHRTNCSICSDAIEKNECISSYASFQSHKKCEPGLLARIQEFRLNRGYTPLEV